MRLTRLVLRQFRNVQNITFEPEPILNFLVGENAQGKTSLIEAIHFLSTLRSFRTGRTQDLVMLGTEGFLVEGHVLSVNQNENAVLKVKVEGGVRKTFVNDKSIPSSKFITRLRSVVFSPESLAAIKSGPDMRRDLIDMAVFQVSPKAAQAQRDFAKALKQRNALLRQLRDNRIPQKQGFSVLESLDPQYLDLATEVVSDRLRFLDEIFPAYEEALTNITGLEAKPHFLYQSGGKAWQERQFADIKKRLSAELNDSTRRISEAALGLTLTGPHRQDITFLFNGNDSRIYCSQGQQRALILAFKIAEIMYHKRAFGSYPLLLLDDVLSEFDEKKRRYLIEFLRKNEAQTFLTTTDENQALQGCSMIRIRSGALELR